MAAVQEQPLTGGEGALAPPADQRRRPSRRVLITAISSLGALVAAGTAFALARGGDETEGAETSGGETPGATAAPFDYEGEDVDSSVTTAIPGDTETTLSTEEIILPERLCDTITGTVSQGTMLGWLNSGPGDVTEAGCRDVPLGSERGLISESYLAVTNGGYAYVSVHDRTVEEEVVSSEQGVPAPGVPPWGSRDGYTGNFQVEPFDIETADGHTLPAAGNETVIRVYTKDEKYYIDMNVVQNPADTQATTQPIVVGGAITAPYAEAFSGLVKAVFEEDVVWPEAAAGPETVTTFPPADTTPDTGYDFSAPPEDMPDGLPPGSTWPDDYGFVWEVQNDGSVINIGQEE